MTILFFEKKSRQKKLQLSGSLCRVLIICTDRACKKSKRNFGYREVFRLPCVKGFASMRSMLAGVAETGSETAQRLEGFASVRSTLAGLAERGSETAQRLEGCEKNNSSPPAAESKPNNQNRTKNKTEAGASVLFFSPLRFFNLIALRLFLQKSAYL